MDTHTLRENARSAGQHRQTDRDDVYTMLLLPRFTPAQLFITWSIIHTTCHHLSMPRAQYDCTRKQRNKMS